MLRQPTFYLPHGGGPWPWLHPDAFGPDGMGPLRRHLEDLPATLPAPPAAVLVVTAHWEAARPTLSAAAQPGMLYDYGGFPPHTYQVQWPAPGSPPLAARAQDLLGQAGLDAALDTGRGFDHGTFVPMAVAWPQASVPTVQLSLVRGLDPALHLAVGRALAPLRDEGVLILGSGMSYHDMRGFGTERGAKDSQRFDAWLAETIAAGPAERDARLLAWEQAPAGRASHPREEHLLPLMVAAGAAGTDRGRVVFSGEVLGTRVSSVRFS